MKIPIRMITIATAFFWIFLVAFFILAFYSVKDVNFALGEPRIDSLQDGRILLTLPISVDNRGYSNIASFAVETEVVDESGLLIAQGYTFIPFIERGSQIQADHNATIDSDELLQNGTVYLFNDADLMIRASIGMEVAEVVPIQALTNLSVPWGAPFYNFTIGAAQLVAGTLTNMTAVVPVGFENHASFDLAGAIRIDLYDRAGTLVAEGQDSFYVQQGSQYDGSIALDLASRIDTEGYFEVYFLTPILDFGPVVVPYE